MKSTNTMAVRALTSNGLTAADAKVIKEWSDAFENMEIDPEFASLEVNRDMQVIINSFVSAVDETTPIKNLLNRWEPDQVNIEDEGVRFVIDEVMRVSNQIKWLDTHDDGVSEAERRVNYNNRERFEDAAIAYLVIKFSSLWIDSHSIMQINSMVEFDLFNLNSFGFNDLRRIGSRKLDEMISDVVLGEVDNFQSYPTSIIKLAAKERTIEWSQVRAVKSGTEINKIKHPDTEWLVEGVIPKTVDPDSPYVGFLYGNSGTYKSFIAVGLCSAICRGEKGAAGFAGLAKANCKPGKVMYLSGEDSYGIRVRFESEAGGVVPDCVRMNLNELDSIFDEDGNFDEAILCCVFDHQPDLIVMDTMNSLKLCENNNSSASVSKMMHKLKELGTTVMIIHHTTKSGDSMEGSHAMTSNADFIMRTDIVEREDDIPVVDLSCGKLKNAAKFKPMRIELVDKGESLVCCNHSSYEEAREAEAKELGLDPTLLRLIIESGETGITVPQLSNHKDVNWKHSRQHLIGTLDKNIDDMVNGWADVVKVSSPGVATRYILGAKYKAKL